METIRMQALEFLKTVPNRTKMKIVKTFSEMEKDSTRFAISIVASKIVLSLANLPANQDIRNELANILTAWGMSVNAVNSAEDFLSYMVAYAAQKAFNYSTLNDKGAFGDLVETVVHLLVNRKMWRVKIANLHVTAIGKVDAKYNGKLWEIGTNGKSFTDSILDDAMHGKFTGIMYGVFSDKVKEAIFDAFEHKRAFDAFAMIAKRLYLFEDKYDFASFIDGISRSKSLKWKGAYYQLDYNPSKHKAFTTAIEKTNFPSLFDELKDETDLF